LVRQDGEQPAGLLAQRVFNSYTKAFNNRYERSGTLFEDRYKAILVDSDDYLRHLCCYIHANPVHHLIAYAPELWPYSNYQDWIGKRSGRMLDRAFIQAHFRDVATYIARVYSYITGKLALPAGLAQYLGSL
jgi:hypothetical protein